MESTFVSIYETNYWGNNQEPGYKGSSGHGSTAIVNREYIPFLRRFIQDKGIKTVVDVGCGDFQIGEQLYDDLEIRYTGYDAYKKLIEHHSARWPTPKYTFQHLDVFEGRDSIQSADLCILKDVLQHWPLKNIYTFLDSLTDTRRFKYILICNCSHQTVDNTDIKTGEFRPLSSHYLPLRKYSPKAIFRYNTKEVNVIEAPQEPIVVAILAKDKAYSLPIYLDCLLRQTYPKSLLHLYIRTNDNTDDTVSILKAFLEEHGSKYASIFYDDSSVSESLKEYKTHEWNPHRFKILGKIRQESVTYANQKGAHYMVIDCDNFIVPQTIRTLQENAHNGVIAPMLITDTNYSNFHYDIDKNGYYKDHAMYRPVLSRTVKGLIEVPVVHCTYMIHNRFLKDVVYDDESYRYEYVIFSHGLRTRHVPQILDNRTFYGVVEFSEGDACRDRFNTLWKPYHKEICLDR